MPDQTDANGLNVTPESFAGVQPAIDGTNYGHDAGGLETEAPGVNGI